MKSILTISAFLFCQYASASLVNSSTDCSPTFRVSEGTLAVEVDTLDDNWVTLGHYVSGEFMSLRVQGCETLTYSNSRIFCGDRQIGAASELRLPAYGAPNARLTLTSDVRAEIVGSCNPANGSPLTLVIVQ